MVLKLILKCILLLVGMKVREPKVKIPKHMNSDEVIKQWNKPYFDPELYMKCNRRDHD